MYIDPEQCVFELCTSTYTWMFQLTFAVQIYVFQGSTPWLVIYLGEVGNRVKGDKFAKGKRENPNERMKGTSPVTWRLDGGSLHLFFFSVVFSSIEHYILDFPLFLSGQRCPRKH